MILVFKEDGAPPHCNWIGLNVAVQRNGLQGYQMRHP
jgi:hypothetical protein